MSTNSSNNTIPTGIKNDSNLSDAERSFLATASYPITEITPVEGNTGSWDIVGKPRDLGNGLEIYAMKQQDSNEVVFVTRGSEFEMADFGANGANLAFTGTLHPQVEVAIRYVDEFVDNTDSPVTTMKYDSERPWD